MNIKVTKSIVKALCKQISALEAEVEMLAIEMRKRGDVAPKLADCEDQEDWYDGADDETLQDTFRTLSADFKLLTGMRDAMKKRLSNVPDLSTIR